MLLKPGWTVNPHPVYKPDFTPSDFHLFGVLKGAMCGEGFGCDDKVGEEVVSTKFKLVQAGDTYCYFSLVQGCQNGWGLCIKMRWVSCMFKLYNKLPAEKKFLQRFFWGNMGILTCMFARPSCE
jgi:hypothetical protein